MYDRLWIKEMLVCTENLISENANNNQGYL